MKTTHRLITLLFGGLLVLPLGLAAQDKDDGSDKNLEMVAEWDLGAYLQTDESARFGKYIGLTDNGFEPLINLKMEYRPDWNSEDATSWRFEGKRLGLDSMHLSFDYNDQGNQRFKAEYRGIPNNHFADGMTPFNGIGTGDLTLPSDWVAARNSTTADFETLVTNLSPVQIGWKRERLDLAYNNVIDRNWDFSVDWRHETKDGTRSFGGVIGNSGGNPRAVILPAPIDWETDIMEASFDFANSRYQFGFSLYASWFDNGQTSVTWDNPYGQRSGWDSGVGFPDGRGLYSLEPNNEAMQLRVYGGINLSSSSRLSADVSVGSMEQDDPLFAYSINPALDVDVPLPRTFMDAEIDTTHANIRYTARPMDKLNLVANYTLDDRDNGTPRDEWIYIGGDSEDQKDPDDARINLPYSYEKQQFDLKATWRAARGVRIKGGLTSTEYERSYSEVLASDEDSLHAGISLNRWEMVSLSFDYASSERDVDEYKGNRTLILSHLPGSIEDDDFENLPALRKYNQTDRERDEYRFRVDFFPGVKFNFAISGSWFEDEYFDETTELLGLQESDMDSLSFDMGWYPRDGMSLAAYYTRENYDATQIGRQYTPFSGADNIENNWYANSEDDVETWNIAFKLEDINDVGSGKGRFDLGLDYTDSNVESHIDITGGANINATPLPMLVSKMKSWSLSGSYGISDDSAIKLSYEMQKLRTDDFSLDNVPIDGPSNTLLLGQSAANYDLSFIMLYWSHKY